MALSLVRRHRRRRVIPHAHPPPRMVKDGQDVGVCESGYTKILSDSMAMRLSNRFFLFY